jgi:hypothetical protein
MKKDMVKKILYTFFPFIPMFTGYSKLLKDSGRNLKEFDFWDSNIGLTLKFYFLTIIIPILGTVFGIFGHILVPDKMRYGFFEGIWQMWSQFYVTGHFIDIEAWRWQIVLLLFSFIFISLTRDDV